MSSPCGGVYKAGLQKTTVMHREVMVRQRLKQEERASKVATAFDQVDRKIMGEPGEAGMAWPKDCKCLFRVLEPFVSKIHSEAHRAEVKQRRAHHVNETHLTRLVQPTLVKLKREREFALVCMQISEPAEAK